MSTIRDYSEDNDIVKKIAKGDIAINNLDTNSKVHQNAVFEYLKAFPSKVNSLETKNEIEFLKKIIGSQEGYKLFVNLDNTKHTSELAELYLHERLKEDMSVLISKNKNDMSLIIRKSYDGRLVFTVPYKTLNGEEVNYFDNELQMPAPLISNVQFSIKLDDALIFFRKLDIAVSLLGLNSVYTELRTLINKIYRDVLFETVNNKDSNYYKLTNEYLVIESKVSEKLNECLINYGMSVTGITILDICIPNSAKNTLENDYFNARRIKIENESRIEYEKKSLELYEKKAEIHSKYPGFNETLTEAEKDNAFRRYAYKDNPKDISVTIKNQKQEDNKYSLSDEEIEKGIDIVPLIKAKKNIKLFVCIALSVIAIVFIIIGGPIGFIGCGISLGIMGITLMILALYEKKLYEKNKKNLEEVLEEDSNV